MISFVLVLLLHSLCVLSFNDVTISLNLDQERSAKLTYRRGDDLPNMILTSYHGMGYHSQEESLMVLAYAMDLVLSEPDIGDTEMSVFVEGVAYTFSRHQPLIGFIQEIMEEEAEGLAVDLRTSLSTTILQHVWAEMHRFIMNSESTLDLPMQLTMTLLPDLMENSVRYVEYADSHWEEYAHASPFPHAAVDGLFPQDFLRQVAGEFPEHREKERSHNHWMQSRYNTQNRKLQCFQEQCMGPATRHLISHLKSNTFLSFLENLTGIVGLIPDPKYFGSGLHQIQRGGHLSIHTDFTHHSTLEALWRRVNVFVYLNEDWRVEEWGGALELWRANDTLPARSIAPLMNRLVVFSTSNSSFHGHPAPLRCPPEVTRKSIALYYYTLQPPPVEYARAITQWFKAGESGLAAL